MVLEALIIYLVWQPPCCPKFPCYDFNVFAHFPSSEESLDTHNIANEPNASLPGPSQQIPRGSILVNRYLIQDVIGIGGMGSVYRARDMHFPSVVKLVAVKEMINTAPDPIVRQTIVQNFEREANILVTLSHPAIPKIFDYFTHEERSYLVLEYIHGKDLEALMNETDGAFSEDQVTAWAVEICDVLQYLHTHKPEPIVFRDMKPSNVMINPQNHVVLIDFGIAKMFRTGQRGTMVGTEGYSPPEQYRGEANLQADLYALGATMHHLLTRRDPRLEAPFTFSERPIRQINALVSTELEAVISTSLKYNPAERFLSALAMKDALMRVAKKTGALERVPARTALGVTGPVSTTNGIKPLWLWECEDEIRGTPTIDNGMLFVGAYDNNLYALNPGNGQFLWKYPTSGGVVTRPVVQDGMVYFGSEDHTLYAVSARYGKLAWTFPTSGPIRSSPRLAEGHIFVGSDDGFLHAVNIAGMKRAWSLDTGSPIRSTPVVSGDYIYIGNEDGDFYCLDYRGTVRWKFNAKRGITSSPLVDKGTVFFASLDSMVYALDARSGWVIWRFRMGKGSISSPCKLDNNVFIGSADGNIYCVDASSAREVWRYKTEHQVSGSPVTNKDSVYCGSADGNLYCLESRNGRLRWKFQTNGPITGAPIVYNDILFVGSNDHTLYALEA